MFTRLYRRWLMLRIRLVKCRIRCMFRRLNRLDARLEKLKG